jgi:hypothetical protein
MHGRIFKEEQNYRGTWMMYLILMVEAPSLILVTTVVLSSEPNEKEAILGLIIFFMVLILVFLLFMNLQLTTRIDEKGIHFKYFPFSKWKTIPKSQIKTMEVISFNPLADFGGWGVKGNKTTKVYTIFGNLGLLIDCGEKKKILIGTQKAQELTGFIEDWKEE